MENVLTLTEYLKAHPCKGFKVHPFYSVIGDLLDVYFENEVGYAETIAPGVDVIRAFSDKRIVGVKLFGIRQLIDDAITAERDNGIT